MSLTPFNTPTRESILTAFANAFYGSYFARTRRPFDSEYQRSLVIMHGWELINAAGWKQRQDMWCDCVGDGVRCAHIKDMIRKGGLLLRTALEDELDIEALEEAVAWTRYFRAQEQYV